MGVYHGLSGLTAIAAATLIVSPSPAPPAPATHARTVLLTSSDTAYSPLGGGTALLMGGTSLPQPGERYLDAANTLYLQPHGFTGALQSLFTPENSSPTSESQGVQILDATILQKIDSGDVNAENPVVVFGYSQSSSIASDVMRQLAGQDVPTGDVRFVLVGDPDNPTGGAEVTASNLSPQDIAATIATPNDLYQTDVYTLEYDGVADSPIYKFDVLSTLNAELGFIYEHLTYLNITPEQVNDAIRLPTSAADTMVNYYMIPADSLPLLDPLRLIPVIGQPLYDLLEPDTKILVNLGYGSIDRGWWSGDADVVPNPGAFPTDLNLGDVLTALGHGMQRGISDFVADLENPATYQVASLVDNPSLAGIEQAGYVTGFLDTPHPTLQEGLEAINNFIQLFTAT